MRLASKATALLLLICAAAEAGMKPNVLMIIVDDLNTMVGCFDGPAITPNIDALGAEGVRFTNGYSACPSCNPSRTALFTGQRPEVTKVFNNSTPFRKAERARRLSTLPQLLKANGYNTISAGKVFHHRRGTAPEPDPLSDPVSWTYQAKIEKGRFLGKNFKENFHEADGTPRWVTRSRGKADPEDKKTLKSTWVYGPIDVEPTNTLDFNTAEFGAAFLKRDTSHPEVAAAPRADEKPFFLACGFFRPHIPILAPREFFDLYTTKENKHRLELPRLPANDLDDLPRSAARWKHWFVKYIKPYPEEWKHLRHAYMAATTYADAAVGVLLEGLQQSGLADNTVVIFIGDHGYQLGEKDRIGKAVVWRGSSRTPMIIKAPGNAPGVCRQAVSLIDLYPTVLELTGLDAVHPLSGESLTSLLAAPGSKRDTPAIITSTSGKVIGVALDPWHYISYSDGSEELYNHGSDPGELTNLLHPRHVSEEHRAVAARLKQELP